MFFSHIASGVAHAPRARRAVAALTAAALVTLTGAQAATARTVTAVPGDVHALAFAGEDLVVASEPRGGGLVVRRLPAAGAPSVLLSDGTVGRDPQVSLAASGRALAIGLARSNVTNSRVLAGPAAGPLRTVASCAKDGFAGPVAVFGSQIAWGETGCAGAGPSIAIGDGDPAVAARRVPLPGIPTTLALAPGDGGLVALLRDGASELRPFAAGSVGAPASTSPYVTAALGVLADGKRVGFAIDRGGVCGSGRIFTLSPGGGERRDVDVLGPAPGRCLGWQGFAGLGDVPRVTADRIVAIAIGTPRAKGRGETFSIVSVRADGTDRREIARGDDTRALGAVAADGDRVAWQQPSCYRGSEVVVDSIVAPATYRVRHCRGEILTRSARLRDGRIAVRVRCPLGCHGSVDAQRLVRSARFAFAPGDGTLRVKVALGARRGARVKLRLHVEHAIGVADTATIGVRR